MKQELNHALKAELEKIVDSFLETEEIILKDSHSNSIKVDFLYNLKNGVDVKITVGRGLDKDN